MAFLHSICFQQCLEFLMESVTVNNMVYQSSFVCAGSRDFEAYDIIIICMFKRKLYTCYSLLLDIYHFYTGGCCVLITQSLLKASWADI